MCVSIVPIFVSFSLLIFKYMYIFTIHTIYIHIYWFISYIHNSFIIVPSEKKLPRNWEPGTWIKFNYYNVWRFFHFSCCSLYIYICIASYSYIISYQSWVVFWASYTNILSNKYQMQANPLECYERNHVLSLSLSIHPPPELLIPTN